MRSAILTLWIILLAAQAAGGGAPSAVEIRIGLKDGRPMVLVPAGEFTQGTRNGPPEERPQRIIYLDAFWIDRGEVTVRAWQR
ncbi:MAG: SUMF1/EgtB/PvdO family nonheme iron enzyme, partial [bacterium]|nr:SUMF1/EgtB/PvdO family nonheme iron enzyme [bacterium]